MRFYTSILWRGFHLVGGALLLWLLITGVVLAAEHGQADSRFDESPLPFLFGVFAVTWAAFFSYAFYMTRRQRELHREIQEMRRALEERKD